LKLIGESTCPGCKKDHSVEIDIDNLNVEQMEIPKVKNLQVEGRTQIQQLEPPKEIIKEITKIPSYIPKYKCKNCKENHKNKDYTTLPKYKCENCGQFSTSNDSCVWCDGKEFDEIEKEELTDLGIEEPQEQEHDHEHSD